MLFCKKSKLFVKVLIRITSFENGMIFKQSYSMLKCKQTTNQSLSVAPSAPASLAVIAKGLFDFAGLRRKVNFKSQQKWRLICINRHIILTTSSR